MNFYNSVGQKKIPFVYLVTIIGFFSTGVATANINSKQLQSGEIPQGLTDNEWINIQAQIAAKHYQNHLQQDGSIKATNTAHNWQLQYQPTGITSLTPKDNEDYSIDIKLTGLGYQQIKPLTTPLQISHKDNTATYQWTAELKEIWTNSAQSFTIVPLSL